MQINGTTYYYVTNLQGDVMGMVDSSGNSVASYTYDPYGKLLTATGELADKNPLRYRGYYYDSESGLYYLQSHYYDPATRRFVNADSYSSTGQGLIGHNMFAYGLNSPVFVKDDNGCFAISSVIVGKLISAAVGAVVNVATTYIAAKATGQDYTWADFGVAAGVGAANALLGPFWAAGISGIYAGYTAYKNGATVGGVILNAGVSAVATGASIGNLADLGTTTMLNIAATASADLTFGLGYNGVAAATNKAVTLEAERSSSVRPNHVGTGITTSGYSVGVGRNSRTMMILS